MKTFCIIPSYNEEKNIAQTVLEVLKEVDFLIVVDDCSTDKSLEIIRKTEAQESRLKVLAHPINLGQGASLQTGNDYALKQGAELVVHFDADGQFLAKEIKKVIEPLKKEEADIVFGSRFLEIESKIPLFKKKLIMPLAKAFNYLFFAVQTSDPQSGFRALNKKALEKIRIENNRMAHCTEILAKAHKYKLRIKEVAITVIYKEFGQKFSGGFSIIKDLLFKKITN